MRASRLRVRRWLAVVPIVLASPLAAQGVARQQGAAERALLAKESYLTPPPEIVRLVTAPRHRNVALNAPSPDRRWFLEAETEALVPVETFGRPWYNLAGLQVDPRANRARTLTTRGAQALEVIDARTGARRAVELPKGATASGAQWSPDGARVAFLANFDDASYLYVADAATGRARRVSASPVLATLVTSADWSADGRSLVTVLLPEGRKAEPKEAPRATGPKVRMTPGTKARTRTYADLLEWPYEKELVEYYTTGQLALVDVGSGRVRRVGAPSMVQSADLSPDGRFVRVTVVQKPFSYTVPVSAFGTVDQVWDLDGKVLAEVARRPLREADQDQPATNTPGARAPDDTARRSVAWMPNGQGLYFLKQDPAPRRDSTAQATDTAAAPGRPAPRRDRLVQWLPPFEASSQKTLLESQNRMADVLFTEDGATVFVAENANGVGHVYAVALAEPTRRMTIVRQRGYQASFGGRGGFGQGGPGGAAGLDDSTAFYSNPGMLMARRSGTGQQVALVSKDGRYAYLSGTRHSPGYLEQSPRPFLDRVEIRSGQKTRLFESAADAYEQVASVLDDDATQLVVSRESATSVPDYYLRDVASGRSTQLTHNVDYTPEVTRAQRRMVPVTRADGYRFWVNVTLPESWRPGARLPAMFWFYPYEYTDQASYDRTKRTYNRNRYPVQGPASVELLVTQGYAVVQPDAPIVGAQGRMNDNYVSDLRNNLAAVIDELDRQGMIDRQRLGIGGHSYGAFSTVNAMVHTPFFKAGIAGDGNYNRTLTPNTFQSERRDLWEARETYLSMSPILYADRLTGALLMYHGLEDQNVGTAPINSERLFHALLGLGKTAALYMYPYEDHGPIARETRLDMWARWLAWLDLYVKNAGSERKADKVAAAVP